MDRKMIATLIFVAVISVAVVITLSISQQHQEVNIKINGNAEGDNNKNLGDTTNNPPPPEPEISSLSATITYPTFEAEEPTAVRGTVSRKLVDGEYMWIVVNPEKAFAHLWPQSGGPIVPGNDLTWKGVAWLGGEVGDKFDILVLVVDKDLNIKITNWVDECTITGDWRPITERGVTKLDLMNGALDSVEVTRIS